MALFPGPQQSVFWYDFEGLTDGNLFQDLGPYGLHATPQAGFVAPNFGLARNAHGKGYANFTGAANVYATLPLRFYTVAPTLNMTLVLCAQHGAQALNGRAFNARTGTSGFHAYFITTERINVLLYDAGAAATQFFDNADVPFTNRLHTSIYSCDKVAAAAAIGARVWHDRNGSAAFSAGNANPINYDVALIPSIGSAGAASYFIGRMYWLILFNFVFTDSEAKAMSAWLMDQV